MREAVRTVEPSRAWRTAGIAAPIVLAGLFFYHSIQPMTVLRPDPPAGFVEIDPDWKASRRETEERMARAYWDCAVRTLQLRYTFGTTLPDYPPNEFQVAEAAFPKIATPAARLHYWNKLRRAWTVPNSWTTTYRWDASWFFNLF